MKFLVAEDDFASRLLVTKILNKFGNCEVAVDGREAVKAFEIAQQSGDPYDLVCLDIMMPELDGHQVLAAIRAMEERAGIYGFDGVRIIMLTALEDSKSVRNAFRAGCEAYLTKPIAKSRLVEEIRKLGLKIEERSSD